MEVTPAQLIAMLRDGTAPLPARAAIARGTLPLPPATMLEALELLADDPDPGITSAAAGSLERLPPSLVRAVAASPATAPALLERVARRYAASEAVALEIARNPASPDAAVAFVASLPHAAALEVVGRNQARLERSPETVATLLANPATPTTVVLLWQEHELRRGGRPADRTPVGAPELEGLPEREPEPARFDPVLVDEDEEEAAATLTAETSAEAMSAKQLSIYTLLKRMSMGQKVALAVKGNREVRNILIRESNKMLCLKVLENPRLSDGDVEAWAKSTNISDDVLRGIANKKEWCKRYPVVRGLVFNPKTPLGISLDFIKRITEKDLDFLAKNRNVPETLRSAARRLLALKRKEH